MNNKSFEELENIQDLCQNVKYQDMSVSKES